MLAAERAERLAAAAAASRRKLASALDAKVRLGACAVPRHSVGMSHWPAPYTIYMSCSGASSLTPVPLTPPPPLTPPCPPIHTTRRVTWTGSANWQRCPANAKPYQIVIVCLMRRLGSQRMTRTGHCWKARPRTRLARILTRRARYANLWSRSLPRTQTYWLLWQQK